METVELKFNDKIISFEKDQKNVMVNATQMAKVFEKEVTHFIQNDGTEKFINVCLKTRNSEFLGIKNREDLVTGEQKSGTWMHRILALKFAAWLDVKFELWVWTTIDQIILGHYREVKAAMYEKLAAEKARDEKREELLKDNPEFVEFLQLEGKITESEKKRQKAIKASMAQLKLDFIGQL